MNKVYLQVILDSKAISLDRPFTYFAEGKLKDEVSSGVRVVVPFGKGNRPVQGMVIDVKDEINVDFKIKPILDIIDTEPIINKDLMELSKWISNKYLSTYSDALRLVLPPGDFKKIDRELFYLEKCTFEKLSEKEIEVLNTIKEHQSIKYSKLRKLINNQNLRVIIKNLKDKSLIEEELSIQTESGKKTEKWVKVLDTGLTLEEKKAIIGKRAKKQLTIMEFLNNKTEISLKVLLQELKTTSTTVRELEKKGLITIYDKVVHRKAIDKKIEDYHKFNLNTSQRSVIKEIRQSDEKTFLLHGVTGSGKTEIYLRLVEDMILQKKDSIVLVPEISLTPQTIDRFVGRFGKEKVAVLHSGLSYGERFDQWRRIKSGDVKVVVGARSAVFAPFEDIGLIVIDEEHEDTYKSSQNPKYETIEVAKKRLEKTNGKLVLGSATPSINSYYKGKIGEYKLLELPDRVNKRELPEIKVIDMREELDVGNTSIFSRDLYYNLDKNLKEGNQSILFLNRRGFSSFISCRSCGYVVECEDCDISMTYHKHINRLKCHYCGKTKVYPKICPNCKSKYIKHFGIGTEQVEDYTRRIFPNAKIARLDADTTIRKGSYDKILSKMKSGKIDILIGTQMISKGLDFENVTLVGIIAADMTLNLPDYRSPEKGFQLITQVAGRAGRGKSKGEVVLQTYDPEHYSIEYGKNHDYIGFYESEIKLRKAFSYPPYINLVSLLVYGPENERVKNKIKKINYLLSREMIWLTDLEKENLIIGPYPAPLERIKNNYRWQTLYKVEDEYMDRFRDILNKICLENSYKLNFDKLKFSIDINPTSVL